MSHTADGESAVPGTPMIPYQLYLSRADKNEAIMIQTLKGIVQRILRGVNKKLK
jgi:hypothetical protein